MLRKILSVFLKYPHDMGDVQFSLLDRPALLQRNAQEVDQPPSAGDRLLR